MSLRGHHHFFASPSGGFRSDHHHVHLGPLYPSLVTAGSLGFIAFQEVERYPDIPMHRGCPTAALYTPCKCVPRLSSSMHNLQAQPSLLASHKRFHPKRPSKEQKRRSSNLESDRLNASLIESRSNSEDSGIHSNSTSAQGSPLPRSMPKGRVLPTVPHTTVPHFHNLTPASKRIKSRTLPAIPNVFPEKQEAGGRLAALFRSVKLTSRRDKPSVLPLSAGKVFGRDLDELLEQNNGKAPDVLLQCTRFIEAHALVDGVYRVSGISSNIQRLRSVFDSGDPINLSSETWIQQDIHCVPALVKLFFRELPRPVCTNDVYPFLKNATFAKSSDEAPNVNDFRLRDFRQALKRLSNGHYKTLSHLIRHLHRVSQHSALTGMTSRNLAIVWAPNLMQASGDDNCQEDLQSNLVLNTHIVQFMIDNTKRIFDQGSHCDVLPKDETHVPRRRSSPSPTRRRKKQESTKVLTPWMFRSSSTHVLRNKEIPPNHRLSLEIQHGHVSREFPQVTSLHPGATRLNPRATRKARPTSVDAHVLKAVENIRSSQPLVYVSGKKKS